MTTVQAAAPRTGPRALVRLAAPLAGVQLAQVALTTTDLVMMGSLSVTAVAAGGLAILLYNQVRTMCVGVVTPVGNLVSEAAGRHERAGTDADGDVAGPDAAGPAGGAPAAMTAEVGGIVRASFAVATVVGVAAALVLVGIGYLLPYAGQAPEIADVATGVMIALAPGLVAMLWMNVLRQFAVGLHRAGSLLGVTIASIGVNLVLDGGFLYGWFGIPVIGIVGVGVATSLVQVVNVVAYGTMVARDRHLAGMLSLRAWAADRGLMSRITRLGLPVSLTYGSEAGITSVATLIMGSFGPVALAAHTVVNQVAYIVYQVNIGLSQGSSILVSRAKGRGEAHETTRVARTALGVAGALQLVLAVVYLVAPREVLRPFLGSTDVAVLAAATGLLWLAILQQVTKGAQNIAVGLMRGLGDTKAGFRASLVGYWGVGLPLMLLCAFGLGWHGPGVWVGLCAGFGATAVLLLRAFVLRPVG